MDFESPDVERDFPGLYASEASKKSNDSDFSDESHDSKLSKKDLLIGKRKDKKDRGYATLEGESSPDEEVDMKSPSKSKKLKPFKFSTKHKEKEKREKTKEKEIEKEKEVKKKEKDSKIKIKEKAKERKKVKNGEIGDISEEQPIFGVSLDVATQRCPCHDGVNIPLVIRECIDHVETYGLTLENVYKVSGIKSKVQQLKQMYNKREPVVMSNYDLSVITSLLKLFLRELPEPILTSEVSSKFEEVASNKDITTRENQLKRLLEGLSPINKMVLAWLITHFNHISSQEKINKMSIQNICSVMGPVLQMSPKLLGALLFHCESILPHVDMKKYIPPLSCTSPSLPDTTAGIQEELKKQDSFLAQLHAEMNAGFVNKKREEQLWEVQRIVTQLKRKLRTLEKGNSITNQRSMEEPDSSNNIKSVEPAATSIAADDEFTLNLSLQKIKMEDYEPEVKVKDNVNVVEEVKPKVNAVENTETTQTSATTNQQHVPVQSTLSTTSLGAVSITSPASTSISPPGSIQSSIGSEISETRGIVGGEEDTGSTISENDMFLKGLKYESIELLNLANFLQETILDERLRVATLQQEILAHPNYNNHTVLWPTPGILNEQSGDSTSELVRESRRLEVQKENLVRSIIEERESLIDLKVQLLSAGYKFPLFLN